MVRDERTYGIGSIVAWLLAVALVIILALTQGCALYMVTHPEKFTAEQIKAYQEVGQNVYWCFEFGGPPPAGATTILVLPKSVKPDLSFSGNCQLMKGNLTQ